MPKSNLMADLLLNAFTIAMVSYSVSVSMALIFANKLKYDIDFNQELLAMGAANVVGSFLSCFPMAASLSRSTIQQTVGGRTQLASLISCGLLVFVLLWIGPFFQLLPKVYSIRYGNVVWWSNFASLVCSCQHCFSRFERNVVPNEGLFKILQTQSLGRSSVDRYFRYCSYSSYRYWPSCWSYNERRLLVHQRFEALHLSTRKRTENRFVLGHSTIQSGKLLYQSN